MTSRFRSSSKMSVDFATQLELFCDERRILQQRLLYLRVEIHEPREIDRPIRPEDLFGLQLEVDP